MPVEGPAPPMAETMAEAAAMAEAMAAASEAGVSPLPPPPAAAAAAAAASGDPPAAAAAAGYLVAAAESPPRTSSPDELEFAVPSDGDESDGLKVPFSRRVRPPGTPAAFFGVCTAVSAAPPFAAASAVAQAGWPRRDNRRPS